MKRQEQQSGRHSPGDVRTYHRRAVTTGDVHPRTIVDVGRRCILRVDFQVIRIFKLAMGGATGHRAHVVMLKHTTGSQQ
jgi:hypothetical protein